MSVQLILDSKTVKQYQQLQTLQNELAALVAQPGVDLKTSKNITSEILEKEIEVHALQEEFQLSVVRAARQAREECKKWCFPCLAFSKYCGDNRFFWLSVEQRV